MCIPGCSRSKRREGLADRLLVRSLLCERLASFAETAQDPEQVSDLDLGQSGRDALFYPTLVRIDRGC